MEHNAHQKMCTHGSSVGRTLIKLHASTAEVSPTWGDLEGATRTNAPLVTTMA